MKSTIQCLEWVTDRMRKQLLIVLLLVGSVLCACAGRQVAEVDIPDDVKEAIEDIVPRQDYVFYALKTSPPETSEDLKNRDLVMCLARTKPDMDLKLIMASRGYLGGSDKIQSWICRPIEDCLPDCIKHIQDNPSSILLMERDVQFDQQEDLIEVVFQ